MSRLLPLATLVTLSVASAGCPSTNHRIRHDDLMSMSQQPPETRTQRIGVVQSLGDGDDPPAPVPPVEGNASVIIVAPIWVGGSPRGHHHHHHGHHHGGGGGGAVAHGGGGGGGNAAPGVAGAKKDAAKAVLVLAAIGAVAMAVTEGTRYDGHVAVHPMHPVHLWGHDGTYTWMPAAHLTPDVAAWADKAVIRDNEGPVWNELGRRPLDRQGFTYSLLMGAGEVALIGAEPEPGFASHLQFGYYFIHQLGLQFDIGYAWADDEFGNTVFDGRYSLELDFMPLSAGSFHAGGYGVAGLAYRSDDGIQHNDQDNVLGGGGLLQLELTTRMALTARLGIAAVHDEVVSELTGGISIY